MATGNLAMELQAIEGQNNGVDKRSAKWWDIAFHNVTAMVGVAVLSLPYAMSELGWGPGVTMLVLSWVVTLFTLWQMVQLHEMVPGKRFGSYHDLCEHAFGKNCWFYIAVLQHLLAEVGLNIIYMVIGGKSLQKFYYLVCKNCSHIRLFFFIMIFSSVHFVLSHLPNSIYGVSLAAAVMSLGYSIFAWTASLNTGVQPYVDYSYKAKTTEGKILNFFSALGIVAFAHAAHNVILEVQARIPSTAGRPSTGPMWRGVIVAYIVVGLYYFPVAIIGYWMFRNGVSDNILITLNKPTWLIAMANMFVVAHATGGYQIYAMSVFGMIETFLEKRCNFIPSKLVRFIARNIYVALTVFVAITFPFFGSLLGFFGAGFSATAYLLPCVMWLKIRKPRTFSLSWFANWICIILGILFKVLPAIGGLRQIIFQAKRYTFYS